MANKKPNLPDKAARDNHSRNLNPNNDQYYKARGQNPPKKK